MTRLRIVRSACWVVPQSMIEFILVVASMGRPRASDCTRASSAPPILFRLALHRLVQISSALTSSRSARLNQMAFSYFSGSSYQPRTLVAAVCGSDNRRQITRVPAFAIVERQTNRPSLLSVYCQSHARGATQAIDPPSGIASRSSLRAMTRKPSCLISCTQVSPLGGCGALVGRQGGTKPRGRDMAAE